MVVEELTESPESELTLVAIEHELKRQGEESRRMQRNIVFFAGMVALLSLASLVAVAAKLGTKDVRVTAVSPTPAQTPAAKTPAALRRSTGVTLKEFTLAPSPATVKSGKVTFNVHNAGQVTHEFVVLKTSKPAGALLKGDEADEAGNVGEIGAVKPGATKSLSLSLKPGHYALICNLPGHYKAGQNADLTVR